MKKVEVMKLDCSACKGEKTMEQTKIPRFGTVLRVIGTIIVIPSLFGVLIAVITVFTALRSTMNTMQTNIPEAAKAGAAIGGAIGLGVALFFGTVSLVGGLVGWIFLMKSKVYKCISCGFVLDRG